MKILTAAEEEKWVTALRNGDSNALHYYYDSFYGRLVFFADRIIADTAQAEDYAIVAITKLWERRANFDTRAAITSFLYQTVKNACLDYLDHLKVRTGARESLLHQQVDPQSMERKMIHAELVASIHETINELPDNYSEVIRMLFIDGLDHASAAQKLNITEANLRNRKLRALQSLKGILSRKQGRELLFVIGLSLLQ